MTYTSEFPFIGVTVDAIIFSWDLSEVLLIERGSEPYKGQYALPGGFLDVADESLAHAASRELEEETGLVVPPHFFKPLPANYKPGRDPRGPVVTNPFYYIMPPSADRTVSGSDDAASAQWVKVSSIPSTEIAFDHRDMLKDAFKRSVIATC